MKLFSRIFRRKSKYSVPPILSRETVVEMMYDKQLDAFADEVTDVIYSADKSMRYVILKDEKGLFTYRLEEIYPFEEDEWNYIYSHEHPLPAVWEPFRGIVGISFFENTEELLKEMKTQPEYKLYF